MVRSGLGRVAVLVGAAVLSACGPSEDGRGRLEAGVSRLEPETVRGTFDWTSVSTAMPAVDHASEPDRWQLVRGAVAPGGPSRWRADEPPLVLRRREPLDAERIDLLALPVAGLRYRGFVRLSWSSGVGRPRSFLLHQAARSASGEPETLTFDLREADGWRGRVDGVELRVVSPPGGPVSLGTPVWMRRAVSAQALAAVGRAPLAAEIANERRTARALACGELRRLALPAGGTFEVDFGVAWLGRGASGSRLLLRRPGQPPLAVLPGLEGPGAWVDHRRTLTTTSTEADFEIARECDPGAGSDSVALVSTPLVRPVGGEGPAPIVLLVSLDTLRADRMSLYGYPRRTTPRLTAWSSRRAVVFDGASSPAGSTLPSHATMLTGLPVLRHGAYGSVPLAGELETLAESLAAAGFVTLAATGGAYVHPSYGFAQGFDRFSYWPRGADSAANELPATLATVRRWLDEYRDWPLFLFFHTYEIHGPYRPRPGYLDRWTSWAGDPEARIWPRDRFGDLPGPASPRSPDPDDVFLRLRTREAVLEAGDERRLLSPDEWPTAGDFYDSGIARADDLVGELLVEIERSESEARPILVVVTSDHGEALGDHGLWGHGYTYEHNLRVPLVVGGSAIASPGRRIAGNVGLDALYPTVLDLALGSNGPGRTVGSLATLIRSESASTLPDEIVTSYSPDLAQGLALRRGSLKLLVRDTAFLPGRLPEEAYDLARDPGESNPIPAGDRRLAELRREALRRLGTPGNPGLLLQLDNESDGPVQGTLRSDRFTLQAVKWAIRPCTGCLELAGPGRIRYRLDSRSSVAFRLALAASEIEVVSIRDLPDAAEVLGRARAADLCGRRTRLISDGPIRLTAELHGDCGSDRSDPGATEGELRSRLRALGYI